MKKVSRLHMLEKANRRVLIFGMGVLLVLTVILSFFLGRYPISPGELFGIVWNHTLGTLFPKIAITEVFWQASQETILFQIRLPRILLATMVGACLSAAGATYQGVFQNPMAAPDVLGASSGAAFGAALAILLNRNSAEIMIFAFLCSIFTVALVFFLSHCTRGSQIIGLVLSGMMISSMFSAGTSFIKLVADPNSQLPEITYWLMGSVAKAKRDQIKLVCIPMLLGLLILLIIRWRINVLAIGEEEAKAMGVNTKQIRLLTVFAATLITAASVSVSGIVGWIGLVIPHLSRRLVGNNYKYLLPMSILFGGVFLLWVDNVSRNLLATEIPMGILTAFIGAPFFIYLLMQERGV